MKLDRMLQLAIAGAAISLACGCSATAPQAPVVAEAPGAATLNYAIVEGPAPKVGKPSRESDEAAPAESLGAPKEPRRAGSRRAGGFGSWK
ncbi:MAG: hypothetical protein KF819_19035 [Labilithrix sp.]|nr:hypothetical protein [Labilithrix sp.]